MNFKDKIIVVTGGSSGIGKQIVIDLVDQGALVCAISRNKKKLDKLLFVFNHLTHRSSVKPG